MKSKANTKIQMRLQKAFCPNMKYSTYVLTCIEPKHDH